MSKETEKMFKELHKFLEERPVENPTEEDMDRLVNEFMEQYKDSIPVMATEETAETSDDYLELAYSAGSMKDALKFARKALKLDPHNYDAESMVIELKAKDGTGLVRDYARAVQKATKHMEEEGYFEEEYIGEFWPVLETRPYMRLRGQYVHALIHCGMIGQAREECKELLRLCEGDNLGMRYVLMHIYAYFEDELGARSLHKQFDSYDETQMLLPLSILYYKKGDFAKAAQYLRKLNSVNKDLKRFLRIVLGETEDDFDGFEIEGAFRPFSIEELMMELNENSFLFIGLDAYMEWALEQVEKGK